MSAVAKRLWWVGLVVVVAGGVALQTARSGRDFKRLEALPASPPLVKVPVFKRGQNAFLVYQKAAREHDPVKALKLVRSARALPGFAWTVGASGLPRKLAADSQGLDQALARAMAQEPVEALRDWLWLVRRLRRDPNVSSADLPMLERRNYDASRKVLGLPLKTLPEKDLKALLADLNQLAGGSLSPREALAHALATYRLRAETRRFKEALRQAWADPAVLDDLLEHGVYPELDAALARRDFRAYQDRWADWAQAGPFLADLEKALATGDVRGYAGRVEAWKAQVRVRPADWTFRERGEVWQGLPPPSQPVLSQLWQATDEAARVAVAAELFRRRRGQPAAKPADLVPAFLPAFPADPFDRTRPLRYDMGRLWSVGWDGQDDGGQPGLSVDALLAQQQRGDVLLIPAQD